MFCFAKFLNNNQQNVLNIEHMKKLTREHFILVIFELISTRISCTAREKFYANIMLVYRVVCN